MIGDQIGHGSTTTVRLGQVPVAAPHAGCANPLAVAVKSMRPNAHNDTHFRRERDALALLADEPAVVNLHAFEELGSDENGRAARLLFLEYCPNGEFFGLVEQFPEGLPEEVARIYAGQIWRAVAALHARGVRHRDLKPENMLLAADFSLRLADFGTALIRGEDSSVEFCGTTSYIAPEVNFHHVAPYDPAAADVWSAGVVAFVALWGVPPFIENRPRCWFFRQVRDGRWDRFWYQHERARPGSPALSPAAKAFLQRALVPVAGNRPLAEDMASDPWLAEGRTCEDLTAFMAACNVR